MRQGQTSEAVMERRLVKIGAGQILDGAKVERRELSNGQDLQKSSARSDRIADPMRIRRL